MKNKGFIKFIILFGIIILIFIAIVINFDKFTLSYNGKKEKHQNSYYIINDRIDIIQQIKYFDSNSNIITDRSTIEDIKNSINNNETIKKVIIEITGIDKDGLSKYIDELYKAKEIKKITNLNTIYGDIIYINSMDFDLAFTLDFKNIAYKIERVYSENYNWQYKEIELDTKEKIYSKVKNDLNNIKITNFEPDSMYIKFFNGIYAQWDGEIFVVKDNTNQIIVEYEDDLQNNEVLNENHSINGTSAAVGNSEEYTETRIIRLQIGFEK